MTPEQLRLYLVTDRGLSLGRDIEWIVGEAVAGGVTIVQLREKDIDTREFVALGLRLKALLSQLGVPLIINDSNRHDFHISVANTICDNRSNHATVTSSIVKITLPIIQHIETL